MLIASTKTEQHVEQIPMSEIFSDSDFNCRGQIILTDVVDLAKNIQENGLIQPILIQTRKGPKGEKYRVIAGNRRYKAHIVNNADIINCILRDDLDDDAAMFLNMSENMNRRDLDMLQEAESINKMYKKGYTIDEIKDKLNVSRFFVDIRLKITKLDARIQDDVKAGFLTQEHISTISSLPLQKQFDLVKEIKEKKQQGIKVSVSKKQLQRNPNALMRRKPAQIQQLIDFIITNIGANIGTRCLAWANGQISTQEIYNDLKEIADADGLDFTMPLDDIA